MQASRGALSGRTVRTLAALAVTATAPAANAGEDTGVKGGDSKLETEASITPESQNATRYIAHWFDKRLGR